MISKREIIAPAISSHVEQKNIELINDIVFSETYMDKAKITVSEENGIFIAKLDVDLEGFSVQYSVLPRMKEIYDTNPEYSGRQDFISPNSFYGLSVDVQGDHAHELVRLNSPLFYTIYMGDLWYQKYRKISLTEKYAAYCFFVLHATGVQLVLTIRPTIESVAKGATKDDLIEAVRSLKFILIQVSVGVAASGIEISKIYTNGSDHFVDYPGIGCMPGGLKFIDLSKWKGEDRVWEREDLSYTG